MKNIKPLVLILLFFVPMILLADGAKTLFQKANDSYEKQDYDSSISILDSLLGMGLESSDLYYNLGNAWFKKNEIPKAILNYEKAKILEPNNDDINYNLALANTMIADKIEPIPEFFIKKWWNTSLRYFNEAQWTIINIFSYSILLIFVIVFFITQSKSTKQNTFYLGIVFLIISITTGFYGFQSSKIKKMHKTAIIFTPTVNVKSSPNENANTIFVIHQGTKVQLVDKLKNWRRIKLANGSLGWISVDDFEKI
ncbi:MAG: SH3 domain-containing protein [Bacteroidales bacterium]|nr:SH3 domain-containing protein [Bacteroidales bacterium]